MSASALVLVTGATGLVGSHLARALLAAGYRVRATRRTGSRVDLLADVAARVDWIEGDLREEDALARAVRGTGAVVHAAGLVSYRPGDAPLLDEVNGELTGRLVDACLERAGVHLVYVSSIATLSPSPGTPVVRESQLTFHPTSSTTAYARSKLRGELAVWRGIEEGLDAVILNPSVVLGVGRWAESSCRLFGWVAAGQRFYPPGTTGYVDARDVAAFAKTCLAQRLTGERYILNAENWSYRHFFDAVATSLGVEPPGIEVNGWQAEVAWRTEAARAVLTRREPLLTRDSARRSLTQSVYDNTKSLAAGATYRAVGETIRYVTEAYLADHYSIPR